MVKESTVYSEVDAELMKWLEDDTLNQDTDMGDVAGEIRDVFSKLLEAYNEEEPVDILGHLPEDDRLIKVIADRRTAVIRLEEEDAAAGKLEAAYTGLLDACFKSARLINPLGGFGKNRLEKALEILRSFEKKHWPLVTRITKENIKSFRNLMSEEHYDDIAAGRKRALGAIRMKMGRSCCAGIAVYRVENRPVTMNPVIMLDWLYVAKDFRRQGIANMLMAELSGLALQNAETVLSVNMNIPDDSDMEIKEESETLEAFLRLWKFRLHVDTGRVFYIDLSLLKDNKYLKDQAEGVSSLAELGLGGRDMIQRFFRNRNKDYDAGFRLFAYAHYDFFDPDVSCAIVTGGVITALFLVHRYQNGNYRYEVLRSGRNTDPTVFLQLLRYGYRSALAKGDGSSLLFGTFESAEGYMTVAKLVPDTLIMTQLTGILMPPQVKETVSTSDWDKLRKAAGFR